MGCGCSHCPQHSRNPANVQSGTREAPHDSRISGPSESFTAVTSPTIEDRGIPTTRILFVRHAQAEAKSERKGSSLNDPGLSPLGSEQARKLAASWNSAGYKLDIVCSPMERCLRTAQPLFDSPVVENRRIVCHALLCEHGNMPRDFSQQRITTAIPQLLQDQAIPGCGISESEFLAFDSIDVSTLSRATRIADWLRSQVRSWYKDAPRQTLAVFSHQTLLDCLLRILVDGDGSKWSYGDIKFRFANTGVYEVHLNDKGAVVKDANNTAHLK
mmetsp:Transcript_43722/g.103249  ORF Transcript_43722/g.103249 Transcript_43722/m.103249 type:complete len:272 (+) Transcript_43722:84-899(+)